MDVALASNKRHVMSGSPVKIASAYNAANQACAAAKRGTNNHRGENTMGFVNEKPMTPEGSKKWRTIDYERDAVLKSHGTEPGKYSMGGTRNFELTWKNKKIPFKMDLRKEEKDKKLHYFWELCKLEIPNALKNEKEVIYQLIQESVTEWGSLYDRNRVGKVHIDFTKYEKAASPSIN